MDVSEQLRIDVIFDFACPWCYIGKRRIESAIGKWMAKRPWEPMPAVRYLPYQLHPDVPVGGMPRREFQEQKHGPGGGNPEKAEYVAAVGRSVDLALAVEKITVQPNTLDAHRLVAWAGREGRQVEVTEAIFDAYFVNGVDIDDHAALAGIAANCGLDREKALAYLASDDDRHEVARLDFEAHVVGVELVPYFIFNRKVGVSGAHEVKVLLEAMDYAVREEATEVQ